MKPPARYSSDARWVCAQPSYQRCRSSGKQSIEGILRRHGHLRNHQSERGRQPRRPKNDATSFLGSKRRPGAPVSRMKQRGRSMSLATHPAVFSNFSSRGGSCGSSPPTQSSSWLHIHGITFSKYCQQVECLSCQGHLLPL